ncbi:MAG TPA: type II toxin-antitoxin system RelE/ParE family toxin [Pyrinomonadaceae bacterium]
MKYTVLFLPDAEDDIRESYEWGVNYWGRTAADKWIRSLYSAIFGRLKSFPKRCPLAPESAFTEREVRQLLLGRYRILFEISRRSVIVLHVTGPFTEDRAERERVE